MKGGNVEGQERRTEEGKGRRLVVTVKLLTMQLLEETLTRDSTT